MAEDKKTDEPTYTGAGENTPDPKEALREREEGVKASVAAFEEHPDYDPVAHRDPTRNVDDRVGAFGAEAVDAEEKYSGIDPSRALFQVGQFDESAGDTLAHLAFPSKNAKAARDLSHPGRVLTEAEADGEFDDEAKRREQVRAEAHANDDTVNATAFAPPQEPVDADKGATSDSPKAASSTKSTSTRSTSRSSSTRKDADNKK